MGLLDKRKISKATDSKIAHKTKTKKPVATPSKAVGVNSIAAIQAKVEQALGKYKNDYITIRDKEVLHDYITNCIGNIYFSVDTETTGLDPYTDLIAGICVYTYGEKAAYIPLNHISYFTGAKVPNQLPYDFVLKEFNRLLARIPEVDMFNANFDIRVLRQMGMSDIYCTWDAYLASRLLNENEPKRGLKALHKKYCMTEDVEAFKFDELFKGIPFTKIPIETGYVYAARDAVITTELSDFQRQYLGRTPEEAREDLRDVSWVFHNIEMPCVSVVCDMEDNGVAFDKEYAKELSEKYHAKEKEVLDKFYKTLEPYKEKIEAYRKSSVYKGDRETDPYFLYDKEAQTKVKGSTKLDNPINIASPIQIAILLYDILKIQPPDPKKPRGTGEEILEKIDNPICKAILNYREIEKLLSTYIDKLPDCVNPKDKRIHCDFNQYGADTGRFSSSNPNLQNIPSHNKDIRKMFIARDGYVLMSSDYSQQEPKVMTQMCGDSKMIKAYREGKDLYAEIASLAFNTSYDNCLEFRPDGTTNSEGKERRTQAKSILLGVLYGRGVPSIAEQLGTTTKKAQAIKDSVFKGFPAIPKFEQDSLQMAYEKGFVTTLWGRKRRLPDLQLDEFEFSWKDGAPPDDDLLEFNEDDEEHDLSNEVPEDIQDYYLRKLSHCWGKEKHAIIQEAAQEGIKIIDNGGKIADAERQCVNSRIQGSAADMSKLAMILVGNNKRLKELGFKLLIPVHDELIAECPKENARECKKLFADLMSKAAESKLTIPIKCDVEVTERWYGEALNI